MEKTYTLKKKIKGAMMYPAIVVIAMIIIGVLVGGLFASILIPIYNLAQTF